MTGSAMTAVGSAGVVNGEMFALAGAVNDMSTSAQVVNSAANVIRFISHP